MLSDDGERSGVGLGVAETFDEPAQVDDVLGRLGERDDLRLAGGEGDALLLARAPGEHGTLPNESTIQTQTRGGLARLPRRVGVAGKARVVARVSEA